MKITITQNEDTWRYEFHVHGTLIAFGYADVDLRTKEVGDAQETDFNVLAENGMYVCVAEADYAATIMYNWIHA
jgi:hypothetical protein